MECVVVDNNHLSVEKNQSRSEELVNCQGDTSCRSAVRDKYRQEYDKVQERITTCSGADQCVAVAKELRALQGDYSARIGEIQEKARMQGLDFLTPAEVREWADLRGAMSNIDASRNLVLHRAQVTGGSEETTQEIVKIMGQTGIAASAGVAGGVSKAGAKSGGDVGKGKQPYQPNQGAVGNMGEFFRQSGFGSQTKSNSQKTSKMYDGQSIYQASSDIGTHIKKGDQFYLDGDHKNHLEVFDKRGNFKVVINLDGSINQAKTDKAMGRKLK
ncbi:hemolysin BL-binding protein [Photorhabdus noenieputensis]|uniref:hemolysin BL-binding protein n=1 Tax=Photorhabdus noenieputensis TaxID=1208607 RepID=UPI001BD2120A|nr:hemolysin BL-binding protein [Photorhabdus noenieputensis]MBS9437484.1 hemolysin BL-binding protein [Photorhabdus noenieputensis]MCK3669957.1 hemolysin BL-binding protein [Photorhabdus noenieputensis]